MTPKEMRDRTKSFALRAIKLVDALPRSLAGQVIGRQLLRSATSVGANYRAACRAQSRAEFASKMSIVVEEADETFYWLELVSESGLIKAGRVEKLLKEAQELLAIAIASRKTSKTPVDAKSKGTSTSIVNRQLSSDNRQSAIGNKLSPSRSIVSRQSAIGNYEEA